MRNIKPTTHNSPLTCAGTQRAWAKFIALGLPGSLCLLLCLLLLSCKSKSKPSQRNTPKRAAVRAAPKAQTFKATWFKTPKEAFQAVLQARPDILGVGEVHQVHSQRHIPSSIKRFRQKLLSSLWGKATDLIVETWVTTGRCGSSEKKVTRKVRKMIKRPKKTENQIVELIKAAKSHGIQPHILTVHCRTYRELLKQKGTAQARQLILLITRLLLQKTRDVYQVRRKQKQKGVIVLYGGALHNDLHPSPSLAHYSYVPKLQKQLAKQAPRYVELDLYVPEYLYDDTDWTKKPWYPLYQRQRKGKQTLLIQRSPRSYILLLPWTAGAPITQPPKVKPPIRRRAKAPKRRR